VETVEQRFRPLDHRTVASGFLFFSPQVQKKADFFDLKLAGIESQVILSALLYW